MNKILNNHQALDYQRDGHVFPIKALSIDEAHGYRCRLEAAEDALGRKLQHMELHKSYLFFTFLDELVRHECILDAVEDLIGPDILTFSSSLFIKEPGDERFIAWHQDSTYWRFEPTDILTAWVALTPCHRENGCLQLAPGSHRWGQVEHRETFNKRNMLSRDQQIDDEVIERATNQDVVLQPGEISFHHMFTAHASGPNFSPDRRIGFAIRYMATSTRQTGGPKLTAMLVRGTDTHGYYEPEKSPRRDFDPDGMAFHQQTVERHRATKYSTM